ncbi:hypothetical protein MASR2M39_25690 [Ignavibacteriales bacterium]
MGRGFAKSKKLDDWRILRRYPPCISEKHMEISSGSDTILGKYLSAFNLRFKSGDLKGFYRRVFIKAQK